MFDFDKLRVISTLLYLRIQILNIIKNDFFKHI